MQVIILIHVQIPKETFMTNLNSISKHSEITQRASVLPTNALGGLLPITLTAATLPSSLYNFKKSMMYHRPDPCKILFPQVVLFSHLQNGEALKVVGFYTSEGNLK